MSKYLCALCGQSLPARRYRRGPNLADPVEYLASPTTAVGGVIPNPPTEVPRTPASKIRNSSSVS